VSCATPKFQAAGIELYAISYDDQKVLSEFSQKQDIPYRLLSDIDSDVTRRYGILNDQIGPEDAFFEGIPYPGVYVADEQGVVVAKFFHDNYEKRDSPETLIDAALGRIVVSEHRIHSPRGRRRYPDISVRPWRQRDPPPGYPSTVDRALRAE
jgi:alkyl hydroperoxide reductase subunit AhpC